MPGVLHFGRIGKGFLSRSIFELTFRVESRVRLSASQVFNAVKEVIKAEDIEELGRTDSLSWNVTVSNAAAASVLRDIGIISINDRQLKITSVSNQKVEIRCHWLPSFVKDEFLKSVFASYGKVIDIRRETTVIDKDVERRNGVRVITLETDDLIKSNIPHLMKFEDGMAMLITMPGRPPLCLKCHEVGHLRRDCSPLMQAKAVEGAKRSYAQAAAPRSEELHRELEVQRELKESVAVERPVEQNVEQQANETEGLKNLTTSASDDKADEEEEMKEDEATGELGDALELVMGDGTEQELHDGTEKLSQGIRRSWSDTSDFDITPGQKPFFFVEDNSSKRSKISSTFELLCGSLDT